MVRQSRSSRVLAAVAKQEQVRLSERTIEGLERAKAQGRVGGRPKVEDDAASLKTYRKLKALGMSVRKIATEMKVSPTTVQKLARI